MYFLLIFFDLSNFCNIVGICNGWDLITLEFDEGDISAIMKFVFINKF